MRLSKLAAQQVIVFLKNHPEFELRGDEECGCSNSSCPDICPCCCPEVDGCIPDCEIIDHAGNAAKIDIEDGR